MADKKVVYEADEGEGSLRIAGHKFPPGQPVSVDDETAKELLSGDTGYSFREAGEDEARKREPEPEAPPPEPSEPQPTAPGTSKRVPGSTRRPKP